MSSAPKADAATIEDYLRISSEERVELIRGTIIEKPLASSDHSMGQGSTFSGLRVPFQRKSGGRYPGGWWFFTELPVQFGANILRPDICGYRRSRMPERPKVPVVTLAPDWTCEFISTGHDARDRVVKAQIYFGAGVPHYWIMNSLQETLEVFRRTDIGYALVQTAERGDRIRPEPFDAVEFRLNELFGDDPDDEQSE